MNGANALAPAAAAADADVAAPGPRGRMPLGALRRRQLAALFWGWLALVGLVCLFLGTFVIAFLASLKEDPLESPFRFVFPQIQPSAWFAAADLGAQAGGGAFWGGFGPGADLLFSATWAVPPGETLETPVVEVPRRVPGSSIARALTTDYASDHAAVEVVAVEETTVTGPDGALWPAARHTWRITHAGGGPLVDRLPFTATVPRGQVLIDADLPVSAMERRGRTASWSNLAPGALGLVFDNYRRVWNETVDISSGERLFPWWLLNSFLIAAGRVAMIVALASLAGYALARLRFGGAGAVFAAVIFSMAIPPQVTFVSNYLVIRDLGLLNTPWGVIVVFTFSAHVLLMKQFFEGFPREIEEAAIADGASHWQVFRHVVLPNARPALVTNAIIAFQAAWNDFFWPFVLLSSPPSSLTVQVGLLSLRQQGAGGESDWGLVLAGAFISVVPVVIVFLIFQRRIVDNQLSEGIK
ncbi:carbohydrate ABC transporter membrane protein 2 (CUT1 family) [Hasllibacter halocynthiae]|uniref:Carbohydrate ABC transporter membrane protein 2 (CUT1 family) n=1 Tax=Hasllibacter halocynthiae TaxID=595589 RepID=A0A2T0WZS1_9RHOB|nr:carbohydrate ABC transporter permease [Hasllibacter halocynthiae]PRY92084.1 carbohydrate ABC transporter membrane protein 2 (CUT1 family) [Hasllibacter halocynthiae]